MQEFNHHVTDEYAEPAASNNLSSQQQPQLNPPMGFTTSAKPAHGVYNLS
jgi:hypothetical protein